jgi:heat shock protein HtpX
MVIVVIIAGVVGFFAELFFRSFTNLGWRSGGNPAGARPGGTSQGSSKGPWVNPSGPWGRH